ncbi:hypothetical protein HYH02_008929 [Chlamydomonas schloesseri]|uniref:OTU domain-containing protein n=1 Tax=Chlamydomonas schloesseri TaxID=2026947 RepID=A0A835WCW8_9CHLO|nr:hypothetical protein HYH02_008929 [Chlamydomonas schloesseri]|eukprot:KAG2445061.1 hypothetical protein HYH02_008929 [Chlamydomonas schloesseri]
MAKKDKITVKKLDDAKKAKKGGEEKEAKPVKGKGKKDKDKGKWAAAHEADLGTELAALGLRIKDITGDGNCFFRALGDQLKGEEKAHADLRARIVDFMAQHEDDFAPFVEDDESFGSYIARMKKDGTWAGYMEVVAASRCLGANLTIYQAGQPRWRVINHPEDAAPMLHLAYSDGQHYDSVRCADDFGHGPPQPVVIRGDGTVPARPPRAQAGGGASWDERDEGRVAARTACRDMGLVRQALQASGGDVEGAIERVIEMLAEQAEAEEGGGGGGEAAAAAAAAAGLDQVGKEGGRGQLAAQKGRGKEEEEEEAASRAAGGGASASGSGGNGSGDGGGSAGSEAAGGAAAAGAGGGHSGSQAGSQAGAGVAGFAEGASEQAPPGARVPSTALRETEAAAATSCASQQPATAAGAAEAAVQPTLLPAAASATAPTSPEAGPTLRGPGADAIGGGASAAPAAVGEVGGANGAAGRKTEAAKRRGIAVGKGSGNSSSGISSSSAAASSAPANNKRCPCGSNKKYKACCGPAAAAAARRKAAAGEAEVAAAAAADLGTTVVAQVAALVI